jgi:tRNA(Ile)-lysidine synthase
MDLIGKVKTYCLEHRLIAPGARVLAAVSGGPDSVAMFEMLRVLRADFSHEIAVVHLEHGLRGLESAEDENFVKSLANRASVPFFVKRVSVPEERRKGESPEETARRLRYAFFLEVMKERGYTSVATGHTADDNVETVMYRLVTGTGPRGFSGIRPRNGPLIHPLLCVTREELAGYLSAQRAAYRVDSTNADARIPRNRIRRDLLPLLKGLNVRYREHILNLSKILNEDEEYLREVAERELGAALVERRQGVVRVDYARFLSCALPIRRRIAITAAERLQEESGERIYLPFDVVERLVSPVRGANRSLYSKGPLRVRKEYGSLLFEKRVVVGDETRYLYPVQKPAQPQEVIQEVIIEEISRRVLFEVREGVSRFDEDRLQLDLDALEFPLKIRNRREGDRILLKGGGRKKLKSLFIDDKVPPPIRERIPVLASGERLAGVFCSYYGKPNRASFPFMITASTGKVLVCKLI